MSTRTRKPRTAKKATPAPAPERPNLTLVDLRHPLPVRRRTIGPASPQVLAEARAARASAWCRLPIPVLAWHAIPGTAYARLHDGTLIVHTGGHTNQFTAWTPCRHGAHHAHQVDSHGALNAARGEAAACTTPHAETDAHQALTTAITAAEPEPTSRPRLTAQLKTVKNGRSLADTPKEHPHG
ncbi:hypothetical protein [Streptomyces sp. Wb2n-11]|uniref:hypothetical protein n=1 Tax=Streptomyces sp. Wb2n-11 TaxID=1030533 RepID=UPI000A511FD9|nr:hypothetical protein [Streptomyces sp. Wb2n-11]